MTRRYRRYNTPMGDTGVAILLLMVVGAILLLALFRS